ncbi:MAG: Ig-like domain-containing protein, partial [Clostridia bacterium]|nr:Ig-like domain-containing protein [Clostridia bacterium]
MNKLTKLLSVFIIAGAVGAGVAGVAGCKTNKPSTDDNKPTHEHNYTWVDDENGKCHQHCGVDGCDAPDLTAQEHVDANKNGKCDNCQADVVVIESVTISGATTVKNKESITLTATVAPANAEQGVTWSITEGGDYATIDAATGVLTGKGVGTVTVKATSTKDNTKSGTYTVTVTVEAHDHAWAESWSFDAKNHYKKCTVAGCTEKSDEGAHELNEELKCTTCGAQFKNAVFELIPSNLEATTYADGCKSGIFSVLPDTTVRTRARGANGADPVTVKDLEGNVVTTSFSCTKSVQYNGTKRGFSVNASAPGKLTFFVENGSSTVAGDVQKIVLIKPDGTETTVEYPKTGMHAIVLNLEDAGEYKIIRGGNGTTDVYYAKFEAVVPVTPIEKIEIADNGKVEYIAGEAFDTSKLQLQKIYQMTGMVEPLDLTDENLVIDSSAYKSDEAGEYTIKITYTDDDGVEHKAQYTVKVYDVEAIELGFNKIVQGNSGYNGTYENQAVKQLYFVDDELDFSGLTVKTVFASGAKKVIVTEGFSNNAADIDMSTAGVKEIIYKWADSETIVASFKVYVAAKPTIEENTVNIKVDGTIEDTAVGTVSDGAYQFKTIQQSLEFLGALELDQNVNKVIQLAEGTYTEKVEVKIPNVTIKGGEDSEDAKKYVIEWDALYGDADESGFSHQTDSTATLNVRIGATGFVIDGVTISNKWNSEAYFDEMKGPKYGEHRALAMLIQADKVVVDNCRMLGYQDTLELFTGRQIIKNTYISGRTDFIFGTNNTTYFYKCEIRSIVKSGYVTAFKGSNKGEQDSVLYGAIFDDCDFTAPDDVVTAADTAIGRPWGQYAAVAVINSRLGGHISTKGNTNDDSAYVRYVVMSGVKPYAETVKFVEYNNTGDGAITEAVKGCRMLTAEEAVNYNDFSKIFAQTNNGHKLYDTDWDGTNGFVETAVVIDLKDATLPNGACVDAINEKYGDIITWEGAASFETAKPQNGIKIGTDTVITVNVVGEVTLINGYELPDTDYSITYKDGKATIKFVRATGTYGTYLGGLRIDTSVTPEDSVTYNVTIDLNYDGAPEATVLSVVAGEKVMKPADPVRDSYTFLNWYSGEDPTVEFDFTQAITGAVTIKANWQEGAEATEYQAGDVIDMSAITQVYQAGSAKTTGLEQGVLLDATAEGAKIQKNGDNAAFNNGATIKVKVAEGLTVLPVWHNAT